MSKPQPVEINRQKVLAILRDPASLQAKGSLGALASPHGARCWAGHVMFALDWSTAKPKEHYRNFISRQLAIPLKTVKICIDGNDSGLSLLELADLTQRIFKSNPVKD